MFYWFDDLFNDWGFFNNTWSWDSVFVGSQNWGSEWGSGEWSSGEWGSSVAISWSGQSVSKTGSWVESSVSSRGGGNSGGDSELK